MIPFFLLLISFVSFKTEVLTFVSVGFSFSTPHKYLCYISQVLSNRKRKSKVLSSTS